jgi:hypothetical protein
MQSQREWLVATCAWAAKSSQFPLFLGEPGQKCDSRVMKQIAVWVCGVLLLAGCSLNQGGTAADAGSGSGAGTSNAGRTGTSPAGGSLGGGGGSSGTIGSGVGAGSVVH